MVRFLEFLKKLHLIAKLFLECSMHLNCLPWISASEIFAQKCLIFLRLIERAEPENLMGVEWLTLKIFCLSWFVKYTFGSAISFTPQKSLVYHILGPILYALYVSPLFDLEDFFVGQLHGGAPTIEVPGNLTILMS